MITILITIYIVSIIGAWLDIRKALIYWNRNPDYGDIVIVFCPILNTLVTVFYLFGFIFRDFPNWFFKLPKR